MDKMFFEEYTDRTDLPIRTVRTIYGQVETLSGHANLKGIQIIILK
jgi:hypothetical protein